MSGLLQARVDLVKHARPSVDYCRTQGLDWPTLEAACGGVWLAPIRPDGQWFDVDADGVEAVVIEVLDVDACTPIDVVAWLPAVPGLWFRATGAAPAVGLAHAVNRASFFGGQPLQLYRTPAEWLISGCHGAALLDLGEGVTWLTELNLVETIAVREDDHAREIDRARRRLGLTRHQRLVVPLQDTREAA